MKNDGIKIYMVSLQFQEHIIPFPDGIFVTIT